MRIKELIKRNPKGVLGWWLLGGPLFAWLFTDRNPRR